MKNIHLTTYEKIGLAWGLLVLLIVLALAIRLFSPKQKAPVTKVTPKISVMPTAVPTVEPIIGRLFINPSRKNVKVGENFTLDVVFQTKGKILDGVDAIIRFDPAIITAEGDVSHPISVAVGSHFDSYPRQEVDNEVGVIKVSGYSPKDLSPVSTATSLFTINFQAKKKGTTNVTIDFERGRTNLSTLVERGTSKNILGVVGNAVITIKN